jgi:hypothetical protein
MKSKQFYSIPTREGHKLINIQNIASIEDTLTGTIVTLNIQDESGKQKSFKANLPVGYLIKEIKKMDTSS